jgi:hypothetical protein
VPTQYATPQHLWHWEANIDGGVEVIREKEDEVNNARNQHREVIDRWNRDHRDDPVSDSLTIIAGENRDSRVLTITEGNTIFTVTPTGNQRDIYDARLIKLFNGGNPYYQINGDGILTKPRREINRTNQSNQNYVHDVCSRTD